MSVKSIIRSALITGLAFMVGCSTATEKSENVNQNRVYQYYSASYDKDSNKTSAMAQFRFGDYSGTTLELTGKSNITHATYSLSRVVFAGTSYDGDGTGFKDTHSFTYTNGDGKTFTNSASIIPITFKNAPSSFSRGVDLVIQFDGVPVAQDEEITLYITADSGNVFGSTTTVGDTSVTVSKEKFATLALGTKKMYLKRSKSTKLSQATEVGGTFQTSYETERLSVELLN